MVATEAIRSIRPTFIAARDGSWLAVAGPGAPIRVGSIGDTREDARVRFEEAIERVIAALDWKDEPA